MPGSGQRLPQPRSSAPRGERRPWGWHRLTDDWAARIVSAAGVQCGELVLDIGAGDGALTAQLVAAGARVIAVELHPVRFQTLRERFAGQPVSVVNVDAAQLRLPARPFRVVANPPYTLTSGLLRQLMSRQSRMRSADLVLQRAAVRRFAQGGGAGAGRWGREFVVKSGLIVPRSAFSPRPTVDSAVLTVRRR